MKFYILISKQPILPVQISTMLQVEIPSRFSKVYFVCEKVFVLEKKSIDNCIK